jgi:ElaB/YqjD/DUF883 family membrane-anchored ribosome-binding protein
LAKLTLTRGGRGGARPLRLRVGRIDVGTPFSRVTDYRNKPHDRAFRLVTAAKPQVRRLTEAPMTHQNATDRFQGYGQTTTEGTKDRLRDIADAAGERIKETADSGQEIAGNLADQARHYGEQAQGAVKQFKPFVEKSLKERPMATLTGAAVVGFVLGALWKK